MELLPGDQRSRNAVSARAGMQTGAMTCLSFVECGGGPGNPRENSARSSVLRVRQGNCCWRLQTSRSLRYRLLGDLLCLITILPGSMTVIVLTVNYVAHTEQLPPGESSGEPFPWLKFVMTGLGCLLLALCLVWLGTAVCVYRKALTRRRIPDVELGMGSIGSEEASNSNNFDCDRYLHMGDETPLQVAILVTPPTDER